MIKQRQQPHAAAAAAAAATTTTKDLFRRKDSSASTATTVSISSSSSSSSFQTASSFYEEENEKDQQRVIVDDNSYDYYHHQVDDEKETTTTTTTTITTTTTTTITKIQQFLAGMVAGCLGAIFSTYFPFWIDLTTHQHASNTIYQRAAYTYNPTQSHFDNTIWTYGTDYILAIAMMWCAYHVVGGVVVAASDDNNDDNDKKKTKMTTKTKTNMTTTQSQQQQQQQQLLLLQHHQQLQQDHHIWYSRAMLLTYMLSVLAGGVAHQFFTTLDARNTTAFRCLWTICVGSVTAASGFMGSIGSIWAKQQLPPPQQRYNRIMTTTTTSTTTTSTTALQLQLLLQQWLSESFWMAYAVVVTCVVVAGGWSYQRPAADIFVAGISQFPSTFYIMYLLYAGNTLSPLSPSSSLSKSWRYAGLVAFIANAPLLPAYPLLCVYGAADDRQYLSLGQVNLILHTNLLLAWCGQARVLRAVTDAYNNDYWAAEQASLSSTSSLSSGPTPPRPAVPILKTKKMKNKKQLKLY